MSNAPAQPASRWRPTVAYSRGAGVAVAVVACALIFRRPDLLVLATPAAVVTAWSLLTRPGGQPSLDEALTHGTLREGDATTWHCDITGEEHVDLAVATIADARWLEARPPSGIASDAAVDGAVSLDVALRSTRWGIRPIQPTHVVAASPWAAFRWSTFTTQHPLTTLPVPAMFDTQAPGHPSDGLVGMHRSGRSGEGNEFAGVRPFRAGDRLRRINWARSARTSSLQVNATWADLDTHIALLIDATDDFGTSEGIDGLASSLDMAVRAAGAITEHYAPRGERVSLRSFGTRAVVSVPPGTGRSQLRRILDALARIQAPRASEISRITTARHRGFGGDQLTVVLSPLIAPEALDLIISLGRRGMSVIVVDTLPRDVVRDEDPYTALAWRIRLLERRRELRAVVAAGIPVVTWRGPGSLDQVIRDIGRRSSGPRMLAR